MIHEFERRFAEVLGTGLPSPFAGRVFRVAQQASPNPSIVLGVREVRPLDPDLGSMRREAVKGLAGQRRVLRLKCKLELKVTRGTGADSAQELEGIERLLYAIDAPDFRTGKAISAPGDPGFEIQRLSLLEALRPELGGSSLLVEAEGWFWPVEVPGETGVAIGEIRVRGVAVPLLLEGLPPLLRAGDPAVELALRVGNRVGLRFGGEDPLPFQSLLLGLQKLDGQPGAGVLGGGIAAGGGARSIDVQADGLARFSYTPPGEPGKDQLIAGLDDGAGMLGLELGRFLLETKAGGP